MTRRAKFIKEIPFESNENTQEANENNEKPKEVEVTESIANSTPQPPPLPVEAEPPRPPLSTPVSAPLNVQPLAPIKPTAAEIRKQKREEAKIRREEKQKKDKMRERMKLAQEARKRKQQEREERKQKELEEKIYQRLIGQGKDSFHGKKEHYYPESRYADFASPVRPGAQSRLGKRRNVGPVEPVNISKSGYYANDEEYTDDEYYQQDPEIYETEQEEDEEEIYEDDPDETYTHTSRPLQRETPKHGLSKLKSQIFGRRI